jgi:hypothetical protein
VEERGKNEVVATATEQLANLLEKPALLVCGLVIPHTWTNEELNRQLTTIPAMPLIAYSLKRVSSHH